VTRLKIEPIEVLYPDDWTIPAVFSSPHSGSYYPSDFVEQSALNLISLRQSEDFKVNEIFSAAPALGAPLLRASYPRAFCDVNRDAYELDPSMFEDRLPTYAKTNTPRVSAGIGTIPKIVTAGAMIHKSQITFKEAASRLEICYFPYHETLQSLLKECLDRFGIALLVDCHSMPGNTLQGDRDEGLSDIVLGTRFGRSCHEELSDFFYDHLSSAGYSVTYNSPYAGGYITQRYANQSQNIHALQIEINRNLYMDQSSLTSNLGMQELETNITSLIQQLHENFPVFEN